MTDKLSSLLEMHKALESYELFQLKQSGLYNKFQEGNEKEEAGDTFSDERLTRIETKLDSITAQLDKIISKSM